MRHFTKQPIERRTRVARTPTSTSLHPLERRRTRVQTRPSDDRMSSEESASSGESERQRNATDAEATRDADETRRHSSPKPPKPSEPSEACARPSLACLTTAATADVNCHSSIRTLAAAEPVAVARAPGALVRPELVAALRRVGFELDAELRQSAQGTSRERPELRSAPNSPEITLRAPKRLRIEAAVGRGPPDEEMEEADQSLETSQSASSNSEFCDCNSGGALARVGSEPTPQETPEASLCESTSVTLRPVREPSRLAALAASAAASMTAPDLCVQQSSHLCESATVPCLLKGAPSRTRVTGRALVRRRSASAGSERSGSSLELSLDSSSCLSSPVAFSHTSATSPADEQLHSHPMSSASDRSSIKELKRVLQQQQMGGEFSFLSSNRKWTPSPHAAPFVPRERTVRSNSGTPPLSGLLEDVELRVNTEPQGSSGAPSQSPPFIPAHNSDNTNMRPSRQKEPQRRLDTGKHYCGDAATKTCRVPLEALSGAPPLSISSGADGVKGEGGGLNCVDCMRRDVEARGMQTHSGYLVNGRGVPTRWDRTRCRFACTRPIDSIGGERKCGAQERQQFSGPLSLERRRLPPLPDRVYCDDCNELTACVHLYKSIM